MQLKAYVAIFFLNNKKKLKNTELPFLNIYEYSIFQSLNENINLYKIMKIY